MPEFSFVVFLLALSSFCAVSRSSSSHLPTLSSELVHRFSDEARAVAAARGGGGSWPVRQSAEYLEMLGRSDLRRQKRRLGEARYQMLFPAAGGETFSLGNDFGWLHYTWINIGTPNKSFLVALDTGSDLLWVPCDCIQCAPLSGYRGSWDKDLGMYSPSESTTSQHLPCSHELCNLGSSCSSPKQPCPYHIDYYSENTSSSGLLVDDVMHLRSMEPYSSVKASVIIGCGRKQSGGYLDGIAPDGLLGLGFGDISVPSILARAGMVPNSFSMCFREDESGRILFGDQSLFTEQSTLFVPLDGKYITYIVAAESLCIGTQCLDKTGFQTLIDSGTSFTFLPVEIYKSVTQEFHRQVNASRLTLNTSSWEYCYQASPLVMPRVPEVKLVFARNKSFIATNPLYLLYDDKEELSGFCFAVQSSPETFGTIGQNFMTGYRVTFDRENLKLGWSRSDCHDIGDTKSLPLTPPPYYIPENPLPTNQQQNPPNGTAVSPAVAVRDPSTNSLAAPQLMVMNTSWYWFLFLLTHYIVICIG